MNPEIYRMTGMQPQDGATKPSLDETSYGYHTVKYKLVRFFFVFKKAFTQMNKSESLRLLIMKMNRHLLHGA